MFYDFVASKSCSGDVGDLSGSEAVETCASARATQGDMYLTRVSEVARR